MSDGCWVQFWDSDNYADATLRFDGPIDVNNMDDYIQSDGRKEGNEPDSLKTGSRTWLVVYKDDNYGGGNAMFGPNSEVPDMDDFGVGGNISSFKMFDYRPTWFVETSHALGSPTSIESSGLISAQSVNNYFRTVVAVGIGLIPEVGGFFSTIVSGLWPDVNNHEQVWASYQNYINQQVAGVYWQLEYENLNETLDALYRAAQRYVAVPVTDQVAKSHEFEHFYNLANDDHSYFVDHLAPERKLGFLVPFATLRLAALRENLQHYAYYHNDTEPSEAYRQALVTEIQTLIVQYQTLMRTAQERVMSGRLEMVKRVEDGGGLYRIIDFYNGWRSWEHDATSAGYHLTQYRERVGNALALNLNLHAATSQLWKYFDPDNTAPVTAPVIEYAVGPFGEYQGQTHFEELAGSGRITRLSMWSGSLIDALQLTVDGSALAKVGGAGGAVQSLELTEQEWVMAVSGYATGLVNALVFSTNLEHFIVGGVYGSLAVDRFEVLPVPDAQQTVLTGLSGESKNGSTTTDNIKAITFHWRATLSITP